MPGFKKRSLKILKKLLHILWFSAFHLKSLSFTQHKKSVDSRAKPVTGNEMGCGSDGLSHLAEGKPRR